MTLARETNRQLRTSGLSGERASEGTNEVRSFVVRGRTKTTVTECVRIVNTHVIIIIIATQQPAKPKVYNVQHLLRLRWAVGLRAIGVVDFCYSMCLVYRE